MRAELKAEVRKSFSGQIEKRLNDFQPAKRTPLPPNCDLYEWRVTPSFRLYVVLQLHRNEDSFTVEIGWTLNGSFPEHVPLPSPPFEDAPRGDMLFRLGMLWDPQRDHWWHLTPPPHDVPLEEALANRDSFIDDYFVNRPSVDELLPRVDDVVEDAVDQFVAYGMPYFEKIAKMRGTLLRSRG